jgi:chaperone modulatory protein CbpM
MTYAVVRRTARERRRLDLDAFAAAGGVHPDLVGRLVTLGLLEAERDDQGRLWLGREQLATMARIRRLRAGLPLDYAAVGVVLMLLDRIAALETDLRTRRVPDTRRRNQGEARWTRTG